MLEQAKWIAAADLREWRHPNHNTPLPSPYIVRDFNVVGEIKSAVLNICGIGQAAYYLNGKRIPDSIHPTHVSTYNKSVIYNTYDLTKLLNQGANRIGAILGHIYFADPEYVFRMSIPRMLAELDIEYISGEHNTIVSDTSFMVHDSPTLFSLRRCGERYDANLEIPGWCLPETPLDGWKNAAICAGSGGVLRNTACPPKRIFGEIPGVEIAPGVFDFGENLSGWVRFHLHGKHTAPITVLYSEWLTDDKQHISTKGLQPGFCPDMLHKDVYIPAGRNEEQYEPLFTFHGFRYVEIQGAKNVTVKAVKMHTDITPLASFECCCDTLTKIHQACERSILACAQGAMLDCPQREQNEWTGDGMLTSEVVSMEYDSYGLFYEWMMKFKDDQCPSGYLPSIIPCRFNWMFSFANGLDWSSAIIHIPYYAFKYSGDPHIAELMWENMERAMDYFATRSENCLMDFGVGDWVSIDPMCAVEITDTIYYRIDALMMAEMATALGKDPARWQKLADDIRHDYRAKYVKNGKLTDRCFTALICSVYSGMLDDCEIMPHVSAAAEIVKNSGYALRCGVHGLRMVFDVFGSYGYNELLLKVLTNDKVMGYAKAISDGLSTLPEQFDYRTPEANNDNYPSLNHHFCAMVDGWFFRYVAGIQCEGFGWDKTVIAPCLMDGLPQFRAKVRGITVERQDDHVTVSSQHPFKLELGAHSGSYDAGTYLFTI